MNKSEPLPGTRAYEYTQEGSQTFDEWWEGPDGADRWFNDQNYSDLNHKEIARRAWNAALRTMKGAGRG